MHFILPVRVWLHQGFHVNPTYLHGYGLCCRMSDLNHDNNTASGSNIVNPLDAGRQGPTTRQQSVANAMANAAAAAVAVVAQAVATQATAASQGAHSATATIYYQSLATTMSRLNDDSASNLE